MRSPFFVLVYWVLVGLVFVGLDGDVSSSSLFWLGWMGMWFPHHYPRTIGPNTNTNSPLTFQAPRMLTPDRR